VTPSDSADHVGKRDTSTPIRAPCDVDREAGTVAVVVSAAMWQLEAHPD
jgi:hypothetical protein